MAISTIKAIFAHDVKSVWQVVTALTQYQWRSDLRKIEVLDDKRFVEYTKRGAATTFTVTAEEPFKRWEFDLDNDMLYGHWCGTFSENNGLTEIQFTEDVTPKSRWMKPLIQVFLKKQQARYVADLKKALQ